MRSLPLAVSLSVLLGCTGGDGPKMAPVKGTVHMNGKPLANVGVTFLPEGKGPIASGNSNDQGEFVLMTTRPGDGASIGTHKVAFGSAQEGPKKPGAPTIPEKYAMPDTTDITAEVKPNQTNVFTFELKP
jgi:hypothetical protein